MRPKDKILDDLARIAGGGVNVFSGITKQLREDLRARFDDMALRLDLVPREDFERLELMLTTALAQIEDLHQRLDAIGAPAARKKPASGPASARGKKSAPRKATPARPARAAKKKK